ncbi:MAG TPA: PP2C family serine/threonine-protein phosphatase [Thermoleophilia bacterium]|nr:PP2C family serine/threonine-protein phosphatase [Thermoleophilia bacterium]
MTLVARHGALTDIGLHRKTNEDTFVVRPPLYAVCDGMGGASAGEVASGLAAETLAAEVAGGTPLHAAAEAANAAVFRRAHDNLEQTGMGTTLTAFVLEGGTARFAHIGDSRAYLLRDGELRQVSDDHSLVGEMMRDGRLTEEEAAVHPHRSILSRALGTEPQARIDEFTEDLLPGDVLLLCSDGLSGPVSADAMRVALTHSDPQAAAERLILEARRAGGPDNITAVVVRLVEGPHGAEDDETTLVQAVDPEADVATGELPFVVAAPGGGEPAGDAADALAAEAEALRAEEAGSTVAADVAAAAARRRRRSVRRLGIVAAALGLLTAALAAGAFFLSTMFFIGVDDGTLTVYSGAPVKIGPVPLHAVYRRSHVAYESLSPSARSLVDEQQLRDRQDALDLGGLLGMWR